MGEGGKGPGQGREGAVRAPLPFLEKDERSPRNILLQPCVSTLEQSHRLALHAP